MRKKKTAEYCLGENLGAGIKILNDEPISTASESRPVSQGQSDPGSPTREHYNQAPPLNTILERYANFEKVTVML